MTHTNKALHPHLKNIWLYTLIFLLVFISGCATKHADVTHQAQVNQSSLQALSKWSLRGKLAVITPQERKSANVAWQQNEQSLNMALTTIVGSSIANLRSNKSMATLEADGQTWQDTSASRLVSDVTGWRIPVESLSQWMKGNLDGTDEDLIQERYDNGLLKQFTTQLTDAGAGNCSSYRNDCLAWTVHYKRYAQFSIGQNKYTLPSAIEMNQANTQTRLILRIDSWSE
ncbi:lipoprotein insertase outer membrane protein LolB [Ningiella sp. W23]|uniref:lipoprotein insertase outer membrane protein LolB n=1 Tax=Ningiella sp. W23 TaxID=3023715 RepID=UPI003757FA7E